MSTDWALLAAQLALAATAVWFAGNRTKEQ